MDLDWRLEEITVLALASNRLARALAIDDITDPVRRGVARWADEGSSGGRKRLAQLLSCSVCAGWWTSLAVSMAAPGRRRLRRGVAVAGMQVMLTQAERLVSERGRAAIHEADLVRTVAAKDGDHASSAPAGAHRSMPAAR